MLKTLMRSTTNKSPFSWNMTSSPVRIHLKSKNNKFVVQKRIMRKRTYPSTKVSRILQSFPIVSALHFYKTKYSRSFILIISQRYLWASDEKFTRFPDLGQFFVGFDHFDVVPDISCPPLPKVPTFWVATLDNIR